jgi:hypothetical protein
MPFPEELTGAVDGLTEIEAAHLNNLEAKVGIDGSTVPTSLDYLLKNPSSLNPGHKHTAGAFSGGGDGEVFFKDPADHAWKPGTPDAAGLVAKTGDQTVSGIKTFTAIPQGPEADPTQGNELARKAYVDAQRDTRVAKAGDAMTGPLALPGDPAQALHAAPKQYVDAAIDTEVAAHAALPNAHHNRVHDLQGGDHTASGLTAGHVLRATGANNFAFQALQESDLPVHKHTKLWEQDGGAEAIFADEGGVLTIPSKAAPETSAADTAKAWVEDVNGEAGKAGLHMMNEGLSGVKLVVPGVYLKTSAGDPAAFFEGMLVINTLDNTLKIYADGGFRQLVSWT